MNKAVLISIQPKWCELIASGKKTVEVRKTAPKLQTPFKCYIYCTNKKHAWHCDTPITGNPHGKIIGEFVCDEIQILLQCNSGLVAEKACISRREFFSYLGIPYETHGGYWAKAYGWHISDLKIYDKPKELGEFHRICREYGSDNPNCDNCKYFIDGRSYEYDESDCGFSGHPPLTHPPQSWCYVEELS